MMKKLVTFMLAVVMVATLLPTQAFADDVISYTYVDEGYERRLEQNKKWLEIERTDEYALDFYSFDFDYRNRTIEVTGYVSDMDAIVKEITAGITDEYEKAKAIAEWLSTNMVYVRSAARREEYAHLPSWQYGTCARFASTASTFYRLAGFPAKTVVGEAHGDGSWNGHAWNHVFVNGRWVYVDTTWGEFDLPVEKWSHDHALGHVEDFTNLGDWAGTITVYDSSSQEEIMTVGPVHIGTPFSEVFKQVPELANIKLSVDAEGKYPVRPTDKFSSMYRRLFVKTYRVSFEIQLDNAYKSLVPHFVREDENGGLYAYVTVPEGEKLPQVKLPEKAGYTFIGWRDYSSPGEPFVNEDTDRVTKDMALIAVFQKGTVNYTVSFNTNGGSAVKAATVKANTKVTKPANPTKSGYKFTGWYLDKNCTEPWDFNTNIVRRNTTLYAGWENVIIANPTSSKVLVNGKAVTFEAYTINGNNYFKLRDIAQAVNKTEKNFEVKWDSKNNAINLISNKPYTPVGGELAKGDGKAKVAKPTTSKIYKDGKEISLTAYTINGNNYFKLRDIAKAFNIGVTWDGTTNTIGIDTSIGYVEE
jgi:uncharacterized repeat protein (TIGR02543 family)